VYPAHGAGSLCGKKISKETVSTLGEQRKTNYALQPMSEADFISEITPLLQSDDQLYEAALRDIYGIGAYLYRKKYRFLRFAYVALLAGFVFATAAEVWVVTLGG